MSPTVHRERGYRFFFLSREEPRVHVHVAASNGEAKYWLEPGVELCHHVGLTDRQLREIEHIVRERRDAIRTAWRKHFGR